MLGALAQKLPLVHEFLWEKRRTLGVLSPSPDFTGACTFTVSKHACSVCAKLPEATIQPCLPCSTKKQ